MVTTKRTHNSRLYTRVVTLYIFIIYILAVKKMANIRYAKKHYLDSIHFNVIDTDLTCFSGMEEIRQLDPMLGWIEKSIK